ncbi:MAG TPA: hypothetical protein VFO13_04530 [Arthrobacter sp.]|nr:hypothetical protein [Arthrobacter sp.]
MGDTPQERTGPKGVGTDDTTEYSASKAPETKHEAEEQNPYSDMRLIPGGRRAARAEIGMSAMDRSEVPSEAREPGLTRYGDSPKAPGE